MAMSHERNAIRHNGRARFKNAAFLFDTFRKPIFESRGLSTPTPAPAGLPGAKLPGPEDTLVSYVGTGSYCYGQGALF